MRGDRGTARPRGSALRAPPLEARRARARRASPRRLLARASGRARLPAPPRGARLQDCRGTSFLTPFELVEELPDLRQLLTRGLPGRERPQHELLRRSAERAVEEVPHQAPLGLLLAETR